MIFEPATATYAAIPTNLPSTTISTTTPSAVTYTLTANTSYDRYTPNARLISGYAKDSNGNPLGNQTIYVSYYGSSRYDVPSSNQDILCNYRAVKTNSNGYYSLYVTGTGYYITFLSQSVRALAYALVI
jgi:hypothetical protein